MFRCNPSGLPQDYKFPADLKSLGYFIDTSDDNVKSTEHPKEHFHFIVSNKVRYNDMRKEVMHGIIHNEVLTRLTASHLATLYLPQLTETKPYNVPSVEILTTSRYKLREKKRIIVVFNRALENLGVWSWRQLMRNRGIAGGSAISLVEELSRFGVDAPGLILTNPGQLLYSHQQGRTLTSMSWMVRPRPSAVHAIPYIDPVHNKVAGNTSIEEHIAFIFEHVLGNKELVNKDAEIYLVGLEDGGDALVKFLDRNWSKWCVRVSALALTAPCQKNLSDTSFVRFIDRRCRAWMLSTHPLNTPLGNPDGESVYPRVSGGHGLYAECIMPVAFKSILGWFERVAKGGIDFADDVLEIPEDVKKEAEQRAVDAAGGPAW